MSETPRINNGGRHLSPTISQRAARQTHVSCASWISGLAIGNTTPNHPPPIPPSTPSHSMHHTSFASTLKIGGVAYNVPGPSDMERVREIEEKGYDILERPTSEEAAQMAKEMLIIETSPTTTSPSYPHSRKSRAMSIVGGIVHGLKNIPRAMTHSPLDDRRSSTTRTTRESIKSESIPVKPMPAILPGLPYNAKYPLPHPIQGISPYGVPVILTPPYAQPPFYGFHPPTTIDTTLSSKHRYSDGSLGTRLGGFLEDLSSLPWVASRVVTDYMPGERDRGRGTRLRSAGSWYTVNHPSTPSELSNPWKFVPDPWFPPTQLPPMTEETEEKGGDVPEGGETRDGGQNDSGEPETVEQILERAREEMQARERSLNDLRQIIEYQKKHISVLEGQVTEMREITETHMVDIHRRRSSTRRSLQLKTRNSVRTVTSVQRTLSRPGSSFHDRAAVL